MSCYICIYWCKREWGWGHYSHLGDAASIGSNTPDRLVLRSEQQAVTGSLLCPSSAHWSPRLWGTWEWLAERLIWVDPNYSQDRSSAWPGWVTSVDFSLLLTENGSQDCKDCVLVIHRCRARNALPIFLLYHQFFYLFLLKCVFIKQHRLHSPDAHLMWSMTIVLQMCLGH